MYPLIDNGYVQALLALATLILLAALLRAGWQHWRRLLRRQHSLVDRIDQLLPQTQCGQCGFEGCLPYARAIAAGTDINQCPPGGAETIVRLANLLNELPRPLNPAHGASVPPRVANIREAECIGCTKCIKACPVDAIVGGAKLMHTVIAAECTGCDLCVAPCPVDCIDMVPLSTTESPRWQLPSEVKGPAYPLESVA